MPSLEAVENFKSTVQSLADEPAIRAKLGIPMDDITPPEPEMTDDLADLLGTQPGLEQPAGDLDALLADNLLEQEQPGEEHDVLGDLLDHPDVTADDTAGPDLDSLFADTAPAEAETPAFDDFAAPEAGGLAPDDLLAGLDLGSENPDQAPSFDDFGAGEADAGLPGGLPDDLGADLGADFGADLASGADSDAPGGFDDFGAEDAEMLGELDEDLSSVPETTKGVGSDELSDDFFNTPGELIYDTDSGNDGMDFDNLKDDLNFDEPLPPSSLDDDEFAFDDDGTLDQSELRGLSVSEKEVADFDETGEADEFQLGDFSSQFGITDEDHQEAEALNPADVIDLGLNPEAKDLALTDDEFLAIQRTLSLLPLNLKLAVEEAIGEKDLSFDEVNKLVKLLVGGASAKTLAAATGKALGRTIKIPPGFEKGTGAGVEARQASLWYNIRTVMLPVVRLFLMGSAVAALLVWLGWSFVYHPLSASGLYKQGYDKILAGDPKTAEDLFATAYKRWPDDSWFFKYADAFIDQGEYEYARKKYRQLLKPVIDLTPASPTNGQEIYRNYNKQALLDWAELERDFGFDGKDRDAHFQEADRLVQQVLLRAPADREALLAKGDNAQLWARDTSDKGHLEEARAAFTEYLKHYGYESPILFRFIDFFMLVDSNAPTVEVTKEILRLKEIVLNSHKMELNLEVTARLAGWLMDKDLQQTETFGKTEVAIKTIDQEYGIKPPAKRSQDEKPMEYKPKQTSGLTPATGEAGTGKSHGGGGGGGHDLGTALDRSGAAPAEGGGHGGGGGHGEAPAGSGYVPSLQPKYPLTDEPHKFNYLEDVKSLIDLGLAVDFKLPDLHFQMARWARLMDNPVEEKKALTAADAGYQNLPPRKMRTPERYEQRILTLNRIGEVLRAEEQALSAEKYFQEAQKRYEYAVDQRLLAPQPVFGKIYANLADLYYRESGTWTESLKLLEKAEKAGLRSPETAFKKGVILYQLGDFRRAVEEFFNTENFPGQPELKANRVVLYSMGNALFRSGNYFAAQGYFRELLALVERERTKIRDLDIVNNRFHRTIQENHLKVLNNLAAALYAGQGRARQDSFEAGQATALVAKADEIYRNLTRSPASYETNKNRSVSSINLKNFFTDRDRKVISIYPYLPDALDSYAF